MLITRPLSGQVYQLYEKSDDTYGAILEIDYECYRILQIIN